MAQKGEERGAKNELRILQVYLIGSEVASTCAPVNMEWVNCANEKESNHQVAQEGGNDLQQSRILDVAKSEAKGA